MNKIELRKILRKDRQEFVSSRENLAIELPTDLAGIISGPGIVAGYVSNGKEPDVLPWLEQAYERGASCALPYLADRQSLMTFKAWRPGETLVPSDFGFLQPGDGCADLSPDIILVPMLGFDRHGGRIGQGQGHYDRAFPRYPDAKRIGIAWSVQERDAIPIDPWDVSLDMIVTETGVRSQNERDK